MPVKCKRCRNWIGEREHMERICYPCYRKMPAEIERLEKCLHAEVIENAKFEQTLQAKVKQVTAQRDAILLQAKAWADEAKCANHTVNEVGSLLGGIPNWGPIVKGVTKKLVEVERLRSELVKVYDAVGSRKVVCPTCGCKWFVPDQLKGDPRFDCPQCAEEPAASPPAAAGSFLIGSDGAKQKT